MELELKNILPYLPYEVKALQLNYKRNYNGNKDGILTGYYPLFGLCKNSKPKNHYIFNNNSTGQTSDVIKLLLRPMSDLFKDIQHKGETVNVAQIICNWDDDLCLEKDEIGNAAIYDDDQGCYLCFNIRKDRKHDNFVNGLRYWVVELLFEYHFDVFGLIEKGLAEPIKL